MLSEESADTEPAWEGAGTLPSLKIWRIEVTCLLFVFSNSLILLLIRKHYCSS